VIPLVAAASLLFFDDFSYASRGRFESNGWIVRSAAGPPGIRRWDGRVGLGGGALHLTSWTNGTTAGTAQTQVCQQRKFLAGTYAARVRFTDAPRTDRVVETFYTISTYVRPLDPAYSELDWEYLPNGGWGATQPNLYVTTWETFRPEPHWLAVNENGVSTGGHAGWHTLVIQVGGGRVAYWADGKLVAVHGGRYYPESKMSIDFNLWFLHDGLGPRGPVRRYHEDVDWVLEVPGTVLGPAQVAARVAALRAARVSFSDTVPSSGLASKCNL
jgi:hypothetical protein